MTREELEILLADAIRREAKARHEELWELQAKAMDEIRQLRLLLQQAQSWGE